MSINDTAVACRGRSEPAPPSRAPMPRWTFNSVVLWLMVLPSLGAIAVVNIFPIAFGVRQALHDSSLVQLGRYVGLQNFTDVLTNDSFWNAVQFTVLFSVIGVFGSWIVGLLLALVLQANTPGRRVFKVLLLLPWVVPIVSSTMSWKWLIATPSSPVPALFDWFGFGTPAFLGDPTLAIVVVCTYKVWVSFPFMMIMMSAALESVDSSIYEAGTVDGATYWQRLIKLTLPVISKPIYISWVLMTIFCVNDFPTVYLLTGGGPVDATNTVLVLAFRTAFQDLRTGAGVAMSFLLTLALIGVAAGLYRLIRKSSMA